MEAAVCNGLKQIEEISGTISAVLIGFTPRFSFNDILLANFLLNNPDCVFLQEAPDATFIATSDSGKTFTAPCNLFKFFDLEIFWKASLKGHFLGTPLVYFLHNNPLFT